MSCPGKHLFRNIQFICTLFKLTILALILHSEGIPIGDIVFIIWQYLHSVCLGSAILLQIACFFFGSVVNFVSEQLGKVN